MRPGRTRLATAMVALVFASLLAPEAVAAKDPPKFQTQGTGVLAKGSWIVTLKRGQDVALAARMSKDAGGSVGLTYTHALTGFQFKGSAKAAAALAKNKRVASVTPDRVIHLTEVAPNGIGRIHAWTTANNPPDSAYQAGYRGAGARIAILDTGIDLAHPDLVANIDAASGKNCLNPALPPQDGNGHGTHVSGTAAAPLNGIGVVGVAPEATLVAIKMFDDAGNSSETLSLCALDRVTELNTDTNPNNNIDVVNMSWGEHRSWGSCADDPLHGAICRARASGAILVAGAGNDAVDAGDFVPAAFPEVISVSGYTDLDGKPGGLAGCQFILTLFWTVCDDTFAFFSDYGPSVDVIAPGVQVYSTWTGGGYQTLDGTSMATPHVTGVVALMRAANRSLTAAQALDLLLTTGECPNGAAASADGLSGCAGQGTWTGDPDGIPEPMPNALRAAQAASAAIGAPAVQITNPPAGLVNGIVNVTATATDDIGVVRVEFAVNGSTVATDTNGADGWSFSWDTTPLLPGAYVLAATAFDADGHQGRDSVQVSVGAYPQGNWVGSYGADGYALLAWNGSSDLVNLPNATLTFDQGGRATWANPTTDNRALQSADQSQRRAMTWWDNAQIRAHLTFSSAYAGTLHLYALDWDATNRQETVTVNDGSGPQQVTLSSSFHDGAWLHFPISVQAGGQVTLTVDRLAGANAVLSGLFLGGAGPPPPPPPASGDWVGSYGADGYALLAWNGSSDLVNLPNATLTFDQGGRATWANPTTDNRALQSADQSQRRAMTWWDNAQIRAHLTFSSAYAGTLHLYALDWDATNRQETVTVNDGSGPQQVTLSSSFHDGAWLHFPISVQAGGQVTLTVDRLAGANAVLSGLFLGGGQQQQPTAPGAPTLNTATPGNGQISLTWSAPASNGGSAITGYTATASPGGATCSTGGATTCAVGGLTNGTSYSFTVTATNAAGTGPASNALSATPRTVPGAPTLNTATPGNGQVALAWSAPASNGGSSITGYTATANPGGATCSTAGTLSCTVNGLTNGTSYTFTVTATNAAGTGPASNSLSATPRTVPGAPTLNTASPGDTQVSLAWTAPASDGGSVITGYLATASPGGATCSTSGATLCTVTGLTNGISYSFSVTATNAAGNGPASNSLSATPTATPTSPGAPTLNTATPGDTQVALSWSAPASDGGSVITGYMATASPGGATCSTTGGTICTVGGLTNGVSYAFTVTATNAIGTGPASNSLSATPRTVPGAPTLNTATPGNGQISLTWSAPASNGGSAITGYTATASPGGATCSTGGATTCAVGGLTNGTSYSFTVTATNAAGTGPASNALSATPRTVPGAPTLNTATPGNGQVALAWSAPASNGGSSITGYTATANPGGATCSTAGTLSCTVNGLTNGTSYTFTVTATNAAGTGPASNSLSATPRTVPGAPQSLTATPHKTRGVNLAWAAPASNGGASITSYRIYRRTSGGSYALLATVSGTTFSYRDAATSHGTQYFYVVRAVNAAGEGPSSAEAGAIAK